MWTCIPFFGTCLFFYLFIYLFIYYVIHLFIYLLECLWTFFETYLSKINTEGKNCGIFSKTRLKSTLAKVGTWRNVRYIFAAHIIGLQTPSIFHAWHAPPAAVSYRHSTAKPLRHRGSRGVAVVWRGRAALHCSSGPPVGRRYGTLCSHLVSCLLYTSPSPRD